ncbi:MAG: hypothetical protein ABH842_02995 [Candidatus Micrarchaeota archaeon]
MSRGGERRNDPLVTKSNLTCVEVGGSRYLCIFSGQKGRKRILEIARVINPMGDRNGANLAARKLCEKGTKAFVGLDTEGGVYVAEELNLRKSADVAETILAERNGNGQRREFTQHHGAYGCGPEMVVDHTNWAEEVALRYLDMPPDTVRINAVDQLPGLCGSDRAKRAALVTALHTVADLVEQGHATVIRLVAGELEQGTLHL